MSQTIVKAQRLRLWLVLAALLATGCPVGATPQVVATIKPVHSIVAGVMAGVGVPELLLSRQGSHHHFHLRPSEARTLRRADLVFWAGPGLETGLVTPLSQWLPEERVIALADVSDVTHLRKRSAGIWLDETASPPGREAAALDAHRWFDPRNMQAFVASVEQALTDIDPANQARYRQNGKHLRLALARLDTELAALLAPLSETPYVIVHDAFHYLEQRYNLHASGALLSDSEVPLGAKGLREMRSLIARRRLRCVFYDGGEEKRLARTLTEGGPARAIPLDLQGRDIAPGTDFYFQLMRGLATDLRHCLKK